MNKQSVALLTIAEAAGYLNISTKTLRNWVYRGQVPYVKIGGAVRFRFSDLETWIEAAARKATS